MMTEIPLAPVYRYRALVVRIIDGDTIVCDVDLGFFVWVRNVKIRLSGINAFELNEPGGKEARDFVVGLVSAVPYLIIDSIKVDKYGGRWDGWVYLPDGRQVNQLVKDAGFCK